MKKLISILLMGFMILGLVACGTKTNTPETSDTKEQVTSQLLE